MGEDRIKSSVLDMGMKAPPSVNIFFCLFTKT